MTTDEEKKRDDLLSTIVDKVVVSYGKDAVQLFSSDDNWACIKHWVSTGSLIGDIAISGMVDGSRPVIPFGRVTEISGLNGTGKTTLLTHIMANVQRMKGLVVLADTESALDLGYMQTLGVDPKRIISVTAPNLEEVFGKFREIIFEIKKHGADIPVLIALDSLGGIQTKLVEEKSEGTITASQGMIDAKIIAYNMVKICPIIAQTRTALILTNHVYFKMQDPHNKFADLLETHGGEKLKFYCTLRIRLTHKREITEDYTPANSPEKTHETMGHKIEFNVKKNKMFGYQRKVIIPIIAGKGFCDDYYVFEVSNGGKRRTSSPQSSAIVTLDGKEIAYKGWKAFQQKIIPHPGYEEYKRSVIMKMFRDAYLNDQASDGTEEE